MTLSLREVQCDPIANRALEELMHRYTVAEENSRLVLTAKAGNMKLFLQDLDDLHQLDFVHNQQMVREIERLRECSTTIDQQRESWKVRALMAEAQPIVIFPPGEVMDRPRAAEDAGAAVARPRGRLSASRLPAPAGGVPTAG
jgi:hypothetical protein